jgi:hypothetical protein
MALQSVTGDPLIAVVVELVLLATFAAWFSRPDGQSRTASRQGSDEFRMIHIGAPKSPGCARRAGPSAPEGRPAQPTQSRTTTMTCIHQDDHCVDQARAAPVHRSPSVTGFGQDEARAFWRGMRDRPDSLRVSLLASWLEDLFAIHPRPPFSDPRLEAIRRLTVALRLRSRPTGRDRNAEGARGRSE